VRVKKGYVPPEEQQTYDRWKDTEPAGVPGAGEVHVPPKAQSKSAKKNAARKAKGKDGEAPAAEDVEDVSEPTVAAAAPAAAPPPAAADAAAEGNEGKKAMLEKKVRALRKKVKGIEELEAKVAAGGMELNEDQKSKLASKVELEAEIARWEAFEDVDELGKEVKKLGKKLRQVEELEAKAAEGAVLNADQQGKVANKKKLADELKTMEELAEQLKNL